MSTRRPKISRRDKKFRVQHSRRDDRCATTELVPVRNHRARNLYVRMSDNRLVAIEPGLVCVAPGTFVGGLHVFWPEGAHDTSTGQRIQIRDWREDSMYSTVVFG